MKTSDSPIEVPDLSDPTLSRNERRSHNPIPPLQHYVPDVEARVYDGRLYLYGSLDQFGCYDWCGHQYRVFSAPLNQLADWTDHGISFQSKPTTDDPRDDVAWSDAILYAPDVIRIDDLYYLAFCLAGGGLGLATSPHPAGPFTDAVELVFADGTPAGSIDPTLFVDDDGQPYIYWGQGDIQGAKLKRAGDGRWTCLDQASYNPAVLHYTVERDLVRHHQHPSREYRLVPVPRLRRRTCVPAIIPCPGSQPGTLRHHDPVGCRRWHHCRDTADRSRRRAGMDAGRWPPRCAHPGHPCRLPGIHRCPEYGLVRSGMLSVLQRIGGNK